MRGPSAGRWSATGDRHDLGWVELPGRLDAAELRDLYARADVYAAPAVLEAFGIATLEARTAGLPVVARAGTGVEEFVADGVEGLLASSDGDVRGGAAPARRRPGAAGGASPLTTAAFRRPSAGTRSWAAPWSAYERAARLVPVRAP